MSKKVNDDAKKKKKVICGDSRHCFGKREGLCTVLNTRQNSKPYKDGACPFCKDKREITNGVYYPYNPLMK